MPQLKVSTRKPGKQARFARRFWKRGAPAIREGRFSPEVSVREDPATYLLKRHSFVHKGKNGTGKVFGLICCRDFSASTSCGKGGIFGPVRFSGGLPVISNWVFYPKPEHLALFDDARKFLREGGQSDAYPGTVGSLGMRKKQGIVEEGRQEWVIEFMQAHFKTGQPPELTRAIATYYGGWRQHLLSAVLGEARKEGASVLLDIHARHGVEPQKELIYPGLSPSERERRNAFIQAAEKNSFKAEKDRTGNYIVAVAQEPKLQK